MTTNKLLLPVVAAAVFFGPFQGVLTAQEQKANEVLMGPNFQKGQKSKRELMFAIPPNWIKDEKSAKKTGIYSVLVPKGMKLGNTDRVITIAFQKKADKPGMEDLKAFFKEDLQETLALYPDAQFVRWQPAKLDPAKIDFVSLEMYGKEKDKPSPQRFLILDSGDGYYSVSVTVSTRDDLQLPVYEDFFNSLSLAPRD